MKWTNAGRLGLFEWKKKSWTNTRLKKFFQRHLEVEVLLWNGERCEIARRLLGKNFLFV